MDSVRNNLGRMLRIFIFYIVIHTASSALEYGYEIDDQEFNHSRQSKQARNDQILSNLHSMFRNSLDNTDKGIDDNSDFNYKPNQKEKQQFVEVLSEVTNALNKIKYELVKFNDDGVLTVDEPVTKTVKRYRRDVDNADVDNIEAIITTTETNDTADVTTTETPETVTERVEVLAVKNETSLEEDLVPNDDDKNNTETPLNGRRMRLPVVVPSPEYVTTSSRVKAKLISYLEDSFNDVERKIKPLTNLKIALSNDDHYRIGYIIATIDTLEVNLKKLKNDMNLHQHIWDEHTILDLIDRIKATNTVTTSLIESLKNYLPGFKLDF